MEVDWVKTPDHLTKDPKVLSLIQLVLRKTGREKQATVMCAEKAPTEYELSIWVRQETPFCSVTTEQNILLDLKRECSNITDCFISIDATGQLNSVYIAMIRVAPSARSATHSFQQHVAAVNAVKSPDEGRRSRSPQRDIKKARKKYWGEKDQKPSTTPSIFSTIGGVVKDTLFN